MCLGSTPAYSSMKKLVNMVFTGFFLTKTVEFGISDHFIPFRTVKSVVKIDKEKCKE